MNPSLLQRQAALAGVGLLAAVGAIALGRDTSPASVPATVTAAAPWREARVGVVAELAQSGCSAAVGAATVGVVHPVLPCGAKLVVELDGRRIRTEVVGRAAVGARNAFELTGALADRLGVHGHAVVRWRFAE